MAAFKTLGLVIIFIVLVVIYASFYTVNEGQRALVLRLGAIVTNAQGQAKVIQPGLHFKTPFLNQVRTFDVRLQTLDVKASRFLTEQQRYVIVDYYAKWKVDNLSRFYTRTGGSIMQTNTLLEQKINDALRSAFGKRTISEVITGERLNVMALIKKEAAQSSQDLGIKVVDVRIKQIDLPDEVTDTVYTRMSTSRERIAAKHRADGKEQAEKIRAKADAEVAVIIATARKEAADIRAEGLSQAALTYATAYRKDPRFYSFYRSLMAYQQVFNNKHDMIVLRPDSQFFKYFNSMVDSSTATR